MRGPPHKRNISYIVITINGNIIKLDSSSKENFKQSFEQNKIFLESQFRKINNEMITVSNEKKDEVTKSKHIKKVKRNDSKRSDANDKISPNNKNIDDSFFSIGDTGYEQNYLYSNDEIDLFFLDSDFEN